MGAQLRHSVVRFTALLLALSVLGGTSSSQNTAVESPTQDAKPSSPKENPERQHAFDVYKTGNFVEAVPLLEKLSADDPRDVVVKEYLAFSIMAYSATLDNPDLRKKARVRARTLALEAKKLSDNSGLLQVVLDLPEDGSEPPFSERKDVNEAMKAAEADFVHGDMDKARDGYLHVLILDPKNYEAALFIGDVYFKQHVNGSAGEWFSRAIEIDPNRETAYRYWGDALRDMGKSGEARGKYIQAAIADPYNNRAWSGLNDWSIRTKTPLKWVKLKDKSAVSGKEGGDVNITLDSNLGKNDPNGTAWLTYAIGRAPWRTERFKKEFPNEPKYRHTMKEEAAALHLMVTVLLEQKDFQRKKKDLDPTLMQLVEIDQAGFIEPFALLNRADNEIAQDYSAYRSANREKIYRYLNEFVVPKAPQQ